MFNIKTAICAVGYLAGLHKNRYPLLWRDVCRILYIAELRGIKETGRSFLNCTYKVTAIGIIPQEIYEYQTGMSSIHPLWWEYIRVGSDVSMKKDPGVGYLCELYEDILTETYKMFFSLEHKIGTTIPLRDLLLDAGYSNFDVDFYVQEQKAHDYIDQIIGVNDTFEVLLKDDV